MFSNCSALNKVEPLEPPRKCIFALFHKAGGVDQLKEEGGRLFSTNIPRLQRFDLLSDQKYLAIAKTMKTTTTFLALRTLNHFKQH